MSLMWAIVWALVVVLVFMACIAATKRVANDDWSRAVSQFTNSSVYFKGGTR